MKRPLVLFLFSTLLVTRVATVEAGWILDGIPLRETPGDAGANYSMPDGAGGAIIFWTDNRNGSYDIFAQRVDGFGVPQWTINGVAICAAANSQFDPVAVSDGAGGAIVAWSDVRNGADRNIFVQRVNAAGVPQWTADGVALCSAADEQLIPSISSDEAGGAVVVWQDGRSGTNWDIYARRINGAGTPQWTVNGEPVCLLASSQSRPHAVSDGTGGVMVAFDDARSGQNIYAQRMNSLGAPRWAVNGVPVCTAVNDQGLNEAISDAAGGMIIAWSDERLATPARDIYAQRINSLGAPVWPVDGLALCTATDDQSSLSMAADGAGGAIVSWQDLRDGLTIDIYAQRINTLGAVTWTYDGVALCTAAGHQQPPTVVADGAGGAIVSWQDPRNGNDDVFAQKVNAAGAPIWQYDGTPVCTAPNSQAAPVGAADGAGGMIVAWSDSRSGLPSVYAQRLEPRYGYFGRPEPTIVSASDNPHDQGGRVIVRWAASQRDQFDLPGISQYSLWRSTDVVAFQASAASPGVSIVTDPAVIPHDFAGGAILVTQGVNGPAYWEWITNQTAFYQATYSMTVPTRQDSVAGNPAPHYFKVIAHEYTFPLGHAWESATVSAHSVDNLAPATPIQLVGSRAQSGAVVLAWKSGGEIPDLDHYLVYRSGVTGVTPTAQFFLDVSDAPSFDDAGAPTGPLHYIVTAIDIHGNESLPSNMVALFDATDVGGDSPPVTRLTVEPNAPNPFSSSTGLRVGLPAAGEIGVAVYDVGGHLMRSARVAGAKGWQTVALDARDAGGSLLPNGVYFCRVTATGQTVTRKMVIAR